MMIWDKELTASYCPKCKKTETVDMSVSKGHFEPPSGSVWWQEEIDPPGWFWDEVR